MGSLQTANHPRDQNTGKRQFIYFIVYCEYAYQVRAAFVGRPGFECELTELPGRFKVLHQDMPPALDADAVHALTPTGKVTDKVCIFPECALNVP